MADFYSQCGEDKWIAANVALPARGVFVEIGAADGRISSNTLHWEELGWVGLAVEPDPRQYCDLVKNRKCLTACDVVGLVDGLCEYPMHADPLLSGLARTGCPTVTTTQRTLATALAAADITHVDILSIDTEGTELDVWASRSAGLHPSVVIVEHDTLGLPSTKDALIAQFAADGYAVVHETKYNLIFIPKMPE
jgi:FkbM family methyltransferase